MREPEQHEKLARACRADQHGGGAQLTQAMTKSERSELGSLIRKRERVMRAAARERSTKLLAEFEAQSARIYSFAEDEIWKQATLAAKEAAVQANEAILARCHLLQIRD